MNPIIRKYIIPASFVGIIGAVSYRAYQIFKFNYQEHLFSKFFTNLKLKQSESQTKTNPVQSPKIELLDTNKYKN